ncbi:TPA: DDE-type integrase/transposase/recombinase [Legionella pneumophila subsp. pneumophila]|uniref:Integrase catalytic domain-containing protein n=1 Tax=Legionella pneumophila (strain Lens) TaxID=297245 RepID=Q5WU77_LEGPL|nr:integrase core domain-containing protein [Legionella pneumophila]AOW51143.1 hypothetical protein BE841_01055 [Legionella pneumophila subsp. pneumophila]AOW55255.1 hypothetical protein BE842_07700 [Legionella pneumophila subsp. pneumophila]AOW59193.1 hypothetical protein BE843_13430 [Legionella pneumophila subsp. pneumophila]AOW60618.1 hypothetical protein BE844_05340 [Legionella pneumophila subsp. pneumophila]AOW64650.1 hypothetical protein BE845_11515 [Legionella pneumophila subsp. pneumop
MKTFFILIFYLLRSFAIMLSPGGTKKLVAENIILRKQLIITNRTRKKAPNLTKWERLLFAFLSGIVGIQRLFKTAVVIKPETLLKLHKNLVNKKYSSLFSRNSKRKPGLKGPNQDIINAVIAMKQRNPRFGCRRIAMQMNNIFGLNIDKDVVRRILAKFYRPTSGDKGPSWLTFIGHMKDSLWSIDFFRCESINLKSFWVMIVMDQFSRRIIGFASHQGDLHGLAICCMFNKIISEIKPPKYLSSDNDPLFQFHRWQANLRILEIEEIKTIPYTPISHPFVERLIRICRNELLDQTLFWTKSDLAAKFALFQTYFNEKRAHMGINGDTPNQIVNHDKSQVIDIKNYRWQKLCRGLFQLPIAA